MRITIGENTIDPITGLLVILGDVRVTQNGDIRVTQATGPVPYSTNVLAGTNSLVPGNDDPGVPRGFDEVPNTGPLVVP